MPLINCSGCGREIITEAEACPHCGHANRRTAVPPDGAAPQHDVGWNNGNRWWWWRIAALTAIPLGLLWLCTGGCVVHRYWLLPFDYDNREFCPYFEAEVTSQSHTYGVPLVF